MRICIIVLLVYIFNLTISCQTITQLAEDNSRKSTIIFKFEKTATKLKESSFHLGIEYGPCYNMTEKEDCLHSYWGFCDFNIYGNLMFGKLEVGGISDQSFHYGAIFASLGLNYSFFGKGMHCAYLYCGFKGFYGLGGAGAFATVYPKYVFKIQKIIGVSAGLKYMHRIGYPQRFLIPSIGIQLFMN